MAIEPSATLPWAWYSDPDVLRQESVRIFARSWQYLGHLGDLAQPGDYAAGWAGQIPVVATRAADGAIRAFLNVCRHRGHQLVDGAGHRETLQCPYHAWTYALDGRLRAAPRSEREPGFDPGELGLAEIAVGIWGPFVFVNPDPEAAPLEDALGPLPEQVAQIFDVDSLEFRFRAQFELDANWKVACENFLECYHCPVAHPGFSAAVDVSPDAYRLETDGLTSSQYGPLRESRDSFLADGEIPRSQFHFLWPNFGINVFPGQVNLSCGPIRPLGPERTARSLDYFFAPEVDQAWVDELIAFDDQIGREDKALVEGVQRGIRATPIEHGRLMERSERLVAHFQALTHNALTY